MTFEVHERGGQVRRWCSEHGPHGGKVCAGCRRKVKRGRSDAYARRVVDQMLKQIAEFERRRAVG